MRALEKRIPLAVVGVLFAAALLAVMAPGSRPAVADPDPPNPGHSWTEIGDFPGTMWHSNNDGPASGLDADTVDGAEAAALEESTEIDGDIATHAGDAGAHHTKTTDASEIVSGTMSPDRILGTAWTSTNDGPGSGLDADTVDGTEAAALEESAEIDGDIATHAGDAGAHHTKTTDASEIVSGTMSPDRILGTAWTSTNDGAGSGLDADLLDGVDSTGYAPAGSCWALTGNASTVPGTHFVGTTDNTPLQLHVNGSRVLRLEPHATSPNIIGGYSGNWLSGGVYGAAICGGGVSGGPNRVTDIYGTLGGGTNNQVGDNAGSSTDEPYATLGGGDRNTAGARYSTVDGGYLNTATATASYATIGGGRSNTASGGDATVGGGGGHTASGSAATVGGGDTNQAIGNSSTIAGGYHNTAAGTQATVAGGASNSAGGISAAVGGGSGNSASQPNTTVGGGISNTASGSSATVGGGNTNTATQGTATVAGGTGNDATGGNATVGGGRDNEASSLSATVPGGELNTAAGEFSLAAGYRAKANSDGCFVWADEYAADFTCSTANRFQARAGGGVYLYTSDDLSTGAYLAAGSGSWASVSDREVKENFTPVDGQEVVAALADIPIATWNYTTEDSAVRHMGPTAQDLYAAFGLGDDERYIGTIDADGVALAAIQGLYELSQEQDGRIEALEAENAGLNQRLDGLEARVTALEGGAPLERGSESLTSSVMPAGWLLLAGLFVVGGVVVVQRRLAGVRR